MEDHLKKDLMMHPEEVKYCEHCKHYTYHNDGGCISCEKVRHKAQSEKAELLKEDIFRLINDHVKDASSNILLARAISESIDRIFGGE